MFPTLLQIGPFAIRTYGFLVAVGLFVALRYVLSRAQRSGIPENLILDLVLYTIVAGLVGARITYVLLNWQFYAAHPGDVFRIWEGGLVFYGGFAAGAAAVIAYVYRHPGIRLWTLADLLAPAIALGHVFGRIGCFFAGCCYGLPAQVPWAVKFSCPQTLAPLNVPLHPVQLYEAFGNLIIFIVLDRYNRREHRPGLAFGFYLLSYAALRFSVEFLRGDERGGFLLGLSPSQVAALTLAAVAVAFILYIRKQPCPTRCD